MVTDDGQTWKERIRAAAEAHAARQLAEVRNPALRAQREAAEAERLAQARAAHEAEQRTGTAAHLVRCGLGAEDARRVAGGLEHDWYSPTAGNPQAKPLRLAWGWWKSPSPLLLLVGLPGTGKTLAGGWLLARVRLDYQHPDLGPVWCWPTTTAHAAHFALAGDLAANVFADDAEARRERLQRVRLLVVDELGTEVMSSPWLSLLESLVVRRHGAGLRTVLLSNLGGRDFTERYGARIARRLKDDGKSYSLGKREEVGHG